MGYPTTPNNVLGGREGVSFSHSVARILRGKFNLLNNPRKYSLYIPYNDNNDQPNRNRNINL